MVRCTPKICLFSTLYVCHNEGKEISRYYYRLALFLFVVVKRIALLAFPPLSMLFRGVIARSECHFPRTPFPVIILERERLLVSSNRRYGKREAARWRWLRGCTRSICPVLVFLHVRMPFYVSSDGKVRTAGISRHKTLSAGLYPRVKNDKLAWASLHKSFFSSTLECHLWILQILPPLLYFIRRQVVRVSHLVFDLQWDDS